MRAQAWVCNLGFRGLGFRVLGFRVLGFRVQGLGFIRLEGLVGNDFFDSLFSVCRV